MRYRLAIFDFDGTLADSFPFFVGVYNELAVRHAFRPVEAHEVEELRGYGARQLMARVGLPAWKLPIVASDFVALMRKNIERILPFEGVDRMLRHLAERGVALAIVSSNSTDNVRAVLGADNARLIGHFECGASIFGKRSRLRRVLRQSGVPAAEAIYIGDQTTDFEAADRENVAFGAVAWGYGALAALRERRPAEVFLRVSDIAALA